MITSVMAVCVGIALGALPSTLAPREERDPRAVDALRGVRVELSGPSRSTHVWAASEWTVKLDNQGLEAIPFGEESLVPAGAGGTTLRFEIAKGERVLREFASRSFDLTIHCRGASKRVEPGASAELTVVLHGEMASDFDAWLRGEEIHVRFAPAFETAGTYSVTAVMRANGVTTRSNTVRIEVAGAPEHARRAIEGLEALAKAGICIDVQGMSFNAPLSNLDRIAEFVEREADNLYGAQAQLGLADALFSMAEARTNLGAKPPTSVGGIDVSLARVKTLLARLAPLEIGLERTRTSLLDQIAARELRSRPARGEDR